MRSTKLSVFANCIEAVADHARTLFADRFNLVFQGGEPLLVGLDRFSQYVDTVRLIAARHDLSATLSVQTNGTLLTRPWIEYLRDAHVGVCISIDGPASIHDSRRPRRDGNGSLDTIEQRIADCCSVGLTVSGLMVLSPLASGIETFRYIDRLNIAMLGFIFPAHNYEKTDAGYKQGAYADFLISFFDAWFDSHTDLRVHNFEAAIASAFGKPSSLAGIGNAAADIISFAPDGTVESGDSYGICEYERLEGISPRVGIALASLSNYSQQQSTGGTLPTSAACQCCSVADICGGGLLEHRYSVSRGFDNPSYYCHDLSRFYTHLRTRLREAIA